MRTGIFILSFCFFHYASAQNVDVAPYIQRIHAIEEKLGLPLSHPHTIDDVLQRLDELELYFQPKDVHEESPAPSPPNAENEYFNSISNIDLSGWVMLSYFYDDQRDLNTFTANVVELDLHYELSEALSFTADLDYINEDLDPITPAFQNLSFNRGGTGAGSLYGSSSIGNDDDDDFVLEQLYTRYKQENWAVQGGKFNTPFGLEPIDPWDWWGILPSIVFPLYPHNITGVLGEVHVGDNLSVSPYISNGFDADINVNDSFVYSLYSRYDLTDEINVAFNTSYGPFFTGNNSDDGWLLNADLRYTGIPRSLIGVQGLWFTSESDNIPGFSAVSDIGYYGLLGIAAHDVNQYIRLAIQSGFVEDSDGLLWGTPQERWEFSFIPSFYPAEWFEIRLQYQHIEANDDFIEIRHTDRTQDRMTNSSDLFGAAIYVKF